MPNASAHHSGLYVGEVVHHRFGRPSHRLRYGVFSVYLDIDELASLNAELRLFGYNRPRPFSFRDDDHGPRDGTPPRAWIEPALARAGLRADRWRIGVHRFPRFLGSVFNPLSTWFCHDADSGRLRAILYEVSNTFGHRHVYLVPTADGGRAGVYRHCAGKTLHVSPFFDMRGDYEFRTAVPCDRLHLAIRYDAGGERRLAAAHNARRRPLTDAGLVRAAMGCPHLTGKVLGGIHWEAVKLWMKGARYHAPPPPPSDLIEVVEQGRSPASAEAA